MKRSILFPLAVIFTSLTLLRLYDIWFVSNKKIDSGFVGAIPTKSNKYVCNANDRNCLRNIIKDFKNENDNLLVLGNSQLGAINQKSANERNYAHLLALNYEKNQKLTTIRSIWLPNASLNEMELIISFFEKCSNNLNHVLMPVFLDDTRENNIRSIIRDFNSDNCDFQKAVDIKKTNKILNSYKSDYSNSKKFGEYLLSSIPILNKLQSSNDHFRSFIYQLRNTLLGIKPTSIRRIIPAAYQKNIKALDSIINSSQEKKLKLTIYIPPLLNASNNKQIPYKRYTYNRFKSQIKEKCDFSKNCKYFDLDGAIKDDLWGKKESTAIFQDEEIDFMHFTYEGHVVFSNLIYKILEKDN